MVGIPGQIQAEILPPGQQVPPPRIKRSNLQKLLQNLLKGRLLKGRLQNLPCSRSSVRYLVEHDLAEHDLEQGKDRERSPTYQPSLTKQFSYSFHRFAHPPHRNNKRRFSSAFRKTRKISHILSKRAVAYSRDEFFVGSRAPPGSQQKIHPWSKQRHFFSLDFKMRIAESLPENEDACVGVVCFSVETGMR